MDYILEATQKAMKETIEQMDWHNIEQSKKTLAKQISIIEYALSLNDGDEKDEQADSTSPVQEAKPDKESDIINEETPNIDASEEENTRVEDKPEGYVFRKNLNGGYIEHPDPDDNILLPEFLVREHDLHNGDRVIYTVIGDKRYSVKVVDTSRRTKTDIETFTHGIVSYDDSINRYIVERNINNESIRLDDMPQRFLINDKDAQRYHIAVDDIVDIAWYPGHFERGKVAWKHRTTVTEEAQPTVSQRILNSKQEKPAKKKEAVSQVLDGATVTLIGLEPYWSKFRQLVAERGGECITHCSKDPETSREASIAKSDAVIVGISHTSHSASQHANKICKEYGIPFASMNGFGGQSFLMEVYDKLNIA